MSEAATAVSEKQELGWQPTSYNDAIEGDRGDDVVPLAGSEEVQEAVSEPEIETDEVAVSDEAVTEEETTVAETENEPVEAKAEEEPKTHMIPKERLDQELAKRRQLENQLKELQQSQTPPPKEDAFDFDDAEDKYAQALIEGETDKARVIRKEIRAAERNQLEAEMSQKMEVTQSRTRAQIALDAEVARITAERPELDLNGDKPNQELIDETNELMTAFLNTGYDPVDALRKAVSYTTKTAGINSTGPAVVPNTKPPRKTLSKDKNQPRKMTGESQRTANKTDPKLMTKDDFSKLSNEDLKRLRGDFG